MTDNDSFVRKLIDSIKQKEVPVQIEQQRWSWAEIEWLVKHLAKMVEKQVKRIAERREIRLEEVMEAMLLLLQIGGSFRRAPSTLKVKVGEVEYSLGMLRQALKEQGGGKSLRQLAKTLANDIYEVSNLRGVSGNLYTIMIRSGANFSKQQGIWLSEFQIDNPNCPEILRTAIYKELTKKK